MCAHPYATWRSQSARRRTFVLFVYLVSSYALVLASLILSDLAAK